ncbi:MAG: glycosyltransferase family 2 protein [Calditrichaeota bacterium]|jgi:cellulose synthase/poly-beta-1,6-N-acetylglucosamine synthase-like glycosyltransferase|nr:glycosyltransferase family 2 protein [Calditrichota bacterium]MBT7618945.1 glycosyltransferase family 2 protein [Calditrichota bacterium]MBT7789590.1 glycosyltransferase family 2 protein [Calditrichota bacterium]
MNNIQIVASIAFWIAFFGVFITYIGIPFIYLRIFAPWFSGPKTTKPVFEENKLPSITVLVPAYNEEKYIGARIENLLESDYPKNRLQILVASDQSSDRTSEIVQSYAERGVELIDMPERSGKFGILDSLIPQAKHEIVIITDANVEFKKNAIRKLIQPYADSRIGSACGVLKRIPPSTGKNVEGEGQFVGYETSIKVGLSKLGRVIGAFGGFYSIRKSLFRPLGKIPVHDDLVIPLEVRAQGYKVVMVPDAIATEETLATINEEYHRRIRMAAYNFLSIPRVLRLGWKAGMLDFVLVICYKVLRWISPFLFLFAAISSLVLSDYCQFYQVSVKVIGSVLLIALVGGISDMLGKRFFIATSVYHFFIMNVAGIFGLFRAIKGVQRYWEARE